MYNLANPQVPYKQLASPLKFQTRCVTAFPDKTGYLARPASPRASFILSFILSLIHSLTHSFIDSCIHSCIHSFIHYFFLQVGSIEGRVAVHHVEESQAAKNFTFKCHRDSANPPTSQVNPKNPL